MTTWMLKSEPETYSYDQLVKDTTTAWTGVRNYTARIHLNAMRPGDRAFFYHSGEPKEVVAVVEVTKAAYPDATATGDDATKGWVCVDIKPIAPLPRAITLGELKQHPTLSRMKLVTMSRLSVSPVSDDEEKALLALAEAPAPAPAPAATATARKNSAAKKMKAAKKTRTTTTKTKKKKKKKGKS